MIEHDIENIERMCVNNPVQPKLLLVPSVSMSKQVLKTLVDHGVKPLNLTVTSIRQLAHSIAENRIITEGLNILSRSDVTDVVTECVRELKDANEFRYIGDVDITPGICEAISSTILELLENGLKQLDESIMPNKSKCSDLNLIITEYLAWKKDKYIDYSDITDIALEVSESANPRFKKGYSLSICEFTEKEKLLLTKLNIDIGSESEQAEEMPDNDQKKNKGEKKVDFFKAYGEYNEVKETLRKVLKSEDSFDTVLIAAPCSEPYSQLFRQLLQQYTYAHAESNEKKAELPITFGTGLPLLTARPAQLLNLLLEWIGSDFRNRELSNLISSGTFDIKKDFRDASGKVAEADKNKTVSKQAIVNAIKDSKLTWKRDSYTVFEEYAKSLEKQKDADQKIPSGQKSGNKAVKWLIKFVADVLDKIPKADNDSRIDAKEFSDSLKVIVKTYSTKNYNAMDHDALGMTAIIQLLESTIDNKQMMLNEYINTLKSHLQSARIMPEAPSPNKMHFTTYQKASWIERKNVHIVGLGADNFPGMTLEDPFLLDKERESLGLNTSVEKTEKIISNMNALLESLTGNIIFSYSCFDTVDIRECYPSALFLGLLEKYKPDIVRLVDFSAPGSRNDFIDDSDYWLHHGANRALISNGKAADGNSADAGKCISKTFEMPVLTATGLREYTECKHKFYLKRVLRLKEIEEDDFDAVGWLSNLENGNIYHKICEDFINAADNDKSILSDVNSAEKYIENIANKEIEKYSKMFPAASDFHKNRQIKDILKDAKRFAAYEVNARKTTPTAVKMFAEITYGENPKPMEITAGNKKIKVEGKIDRINIYEDGSAEIIDYKTGSTYGYENIKDPCEAGIDEANVQLSLYYLASKELARTDSRFSGIKRIKSISYRFLTAKGNYETIPLNISDTGSKNEQTYKEKLLEIIDKIEACDFFKKMRGSTEGDSADIKADCTYCKYKTVCRLTDDEEEEE